MANKAGRHSAACLHCRSYSCTTARNGFQYSRLAGGRAHSEVRVEIDASTWLHLRIDDWRLSESQFYAPWLHRSQTP